MEKVARKLTDLIGSTPLLELSNYNKSNGLRARSIMKIESLDPVGSVKDHVALAMIEDVEVKEVLTPDAAIIESTSGNMGVGLASTATAKGYKLILTMSDTMSVERRNLSKALGAEFVLTPGAGEMKEAIAKTEELKAATSDSVILQQFENPVNPAMRLCATGLGIWRDTEGKVDIFVAGIGAGGIVSGVGKVLEMRDPSVKAVAVEPANSPVLSDGRPRLHKIQGIGTGSVPKIYSASIVDEITRVQSGDAIRTSRALTEREGLSVSISPGAAIYAATELAKRPENEGKMIVTLSSDTGERYLSTILCALEEYSL